MHVEFSPPGVPADDVIVDLVATIPADRPVIVATNDNEVRAGARRGGANVISSQQLLAAARR
jgi:rRNA-processing protein FCF1